MPTLAPRLPNQNNVPAPPWSEASSTAAEYYPTGAVLLLQTDRTYHQKLPGKYVVLWEDWRRVWGGGKGEVGLVDGKGGSGLSRIGKGGASRGFVGYEECTDIGLARIGARG